MDAVRLAPHDIRRVDACLSLSQFVSTFEVSAAAAMVETDTARVADSPGRQVIVDMPLTLRRTWDFIQPSANVPTRPGGHGTCRSVGSRARQGGATFHGVPIGNAFGTKVTGVVDNRPESFGELRIGVAGNPAENLGAGQLAVVTRSGTNELHGEVCNYQTSPSPLVRDPLAVARTDSIGGSSAALCSTPDAMKVATAPASSRASNSNASARPASERPTRPYPSGAGA
ncbi:MAG: hypothetical protein RMI94_13655 [Bryobacterales bacterium]|nr:hypothetical protein [Bryobacterales bacterium]